MLITASKGSIWIRLLWRFAFSWSGRAWLIMVVFTTRLILTMSNEMNVFVLVSKKYD